MFCESALEDALSKFNNRFSLDSIAVMESSMREFKASLYELKAILLERRISIINELQEEDTPYNCLKCELTIIASRTLRSFISTIAPHVVKFKH